MTSQRPREDWDVFAREESGAALRHVGSVEAVDQDDAEVFAAALYDEYKWVEMFVTPRRAMIQVIRPA